MIEIETSIGLVGIDPYNVEAVVPYATHTNVYLSGGHSITLYNMKSSDVIKLLNARL